ncbi:hypothetical protein ES703_114991 [subsurface metagenome]
MFSYGQLWLKEGQAMEPNKCNFKFYLDKEGKPVIETGNAACQLIAVEALQGGDVTVKVTPKSVKAEEPVPEPAPDTRLNPTES